MLERRQPLHNLHPWGLALAIVLCVPGWGAAQEDDQAPLYMRTPFDRVILKSGETVDVQPLRFAEGSRQVPEVLPESGELKVRPLDAPNVAAEYSIPWSGIAKIETFNDMILQEAIRLTRAEEFDAAYPYIAHLLRRAPETRGLDQIVNRYLQSNALAAYQSGEFDRALAILGSLYERSPRANGLAGAVDTVAGKIIEQYLRQRNFRSARMTLDVVEQSFRGVPLSVVSTWRQRFERAAASQLAEAERLIEAREYRAARQAIQQAVGVWPELQGVGEVQARLQRAHPIVTVGVLERSPRTPENRLDSPASSRTATLVGPTLVELRGYTAEGGEYGSSIAQLELNPSGLELTFQLMDPSASDPLAVGLGASALARQLFETTDAQSPRWNQVLSELIEQIQVEYPQRVHLTFGRAHVRPEALFELPMSPQLSQLSSRGVFTIADYNDELVRFAIDSVRPGRIAEVHEQVFESDDEAVAALVRGAIDVLDRVPPWQLSRLRSVDGIVVDNYRLPVVHALVPTGRSPLCDQREFRRALCYGIDRESFVSQVLLAGSEQAGFQVVSGPFPAGVTLSDPIRYGYNGQVRPRPYDPYMAIVLATAAWSSTQKSQGIEDPGDQPLPQLKLGHTSDPTARAACVEIAKGLNALEIPIELVELSAEQLLDAEEHVDLKYVELRSWEPVVDARRLLGSGGVLGNASDYMELCLERLDEARSWNDVRARLYEIHEVASTDLPVIPLWQTVNYFAYRSALTGVSNQPVQLYQDVGNWQLEFASERL